MRTGPQDTSQRPVPMQYRIWYTVQDTVPENQRQYWLHVPVLVRGLDNGDPWLNGNSKDDIQYNGELGTPKVSKSEGVLPKMIRVGLYSNHYITGEDKWQFFTF